MIAKIKYVGTDESNVTLNQEYFVLGFTDNGSSTRAFIVNNSGVPQQTQDLITTRWQLVSVEYNGCIQVYP